MDTAISFSSADMVLWKNIWLCETIYQRDKWPMLPFNPRQRHALIQMLILNNVEDSISTRTVCEGGGSANMPHIWKPTLSKTAHPGHSLKKITGHIHSCKKFFLFPSPCLSAGLASLWVFHLQFPTCQLSPNQCEFNCTHSDNAFARGVRELTWIFSTGKYVF